MDPVDPFGADARFEQRDYFSRKTAEQLGRKLIATAGEIIANDPKGPSDVRTLLREILDPIIDEYLLDSEKFLEDLISPEE